MIRVFQSTDKDFTTNGDCIIQPTKAKVHKEDNGDYYLDLEAPIKYADYVVSNNIIVADTPHGPQPFRISGVTKKSTRVSCKAWHVFYDSKNYLIADSYAVDMNCNAALDHFNSATEPASEFTTISDVDTVDSFRCVRKSLYEAIQTVIERWGGHLVRNGFKIEIRNSIGVDNGVIVRYRKDIQELTCVYDWSSVVTKLLPVGADGILLNDQDSSASIYVESSKKWPIPYTKTVSFSQSNINKDDYGNDEAAYRRALVNDLRAQAQNYVEAHCLPSVNYTLKADLDRITDIGDTVGVVDERLGVNLLTNVIGYDYDCILGKYTSIEFGNFAKSLKGFAQTMQQAAQNTAQNVADAATQGVTDQITSNITQSMSASYVIYDGTKIMIVDSLPKESSHNVILMNNNGIAFSRNGINGKFESAWAIDGTLNMQSINVINLVADMIKGGTLKLGAIEGQGGKIELYDAANRMICSLDKNGIIMYATNGGYVVLNQDVGLVGYDSLGNPIYWASDDEFHMAKAVVEDEITLCSKLRFIPMTLTDSDGNVTSDGIGLVSAYSSSGEVI